jgi:uncharacterized protein (DUF433 family)
VSEVPAVTLTLEAEPVPLRIDGDGVVRVVGSRIPIDTIVGAFNAGDCPEHIVHSFPTLKLADVYAIIAYYLRNKSEVDSYLCVREQEAERIRKEIESQPGYAEWRESLRKRARAWRERHLDQAAR